MACSTPRSSRTSTAAETTTRSVRTLTARSSHHGGDLAVEILRKRTATARKIAQLVLDIDIVAELAGPTNVRLASCYRARRLTLRRVRRVGRVCAMFCGTIGRIDRDQCSNNHLYPWKRRTANSSIVTWNLKPDDGTGWIILQLPVAEPVATLSMNSWESPDIGATTKIVCKSWWRKAGSFKRHQVEYLPTSDI